MKQMQVSENAGIEMAEGKNVHQLFRRYIPYWPLFAVLVTLSLGVGWLYLRIATPVYETTATIMVKDEKRGLDDSKILDELNLFGAKKIVENEIEILHSRSILSQVVKNLFLYAPLTEQDNYFTRPAYATSPVVVEVANPDSLIEVAKVAYRFDQATNQVIIDRKRYELNTWLELPWATIRFTKNPLTASDGEGKQFYFSLISAKKALSALRSSIEISPSGKLSTIINLSIKDAVPQRGEAILNDVIVNYNKAAIDDKNTMASNTLDFVEKRMTLMVGELDSMESSIQKFRAKKGVVDISQQSKQYLQSVGENDQQLSEMNVQQAVLSQIEKYLVSKTDQPGLVPSTFGIKDPLLSQMLEKLYTAEMQYEKLRKTTAENNPILESIRNEIARTKPEILENIKNQRRNIEAARRNLTATSNRYDSMLRAIPQKEKELVEISRQQSIKNNIYSFLLQKREEAALSFNAAVSDSRLVDSAESSLKPVSPQKMTVLIIAILIPVILLILIISLREIFTGKILFRSEIENLTVIPVLAELMHNKKDFLVVNSDDRTVITEQFRQLRTAMFTKLQKINGKKIMVTSLESGEGKSYVASNLALSFAQSGKKTVLVECDFYKPQIARAFDLDTEGPGINDFVVSDMSEQSIQSIINKSFLNENLSIVTSGSWYSEPSDQIINEGLDILFWWLENSFDVIIIDAAPVTPVIDTHLINAFAEMTLCVIRHRHTAKIDVQMMDQDEEIQKFRNPFIVFNGIKRRGFSGSGYGHASGYGYTSNKDNSYFKKKGYQRKRGLAV